MPAILNAEIISFPGELILNLATNVLKIEIFPAKNRSGSAKK